MDMNREQLDKLRSRPEVRSALESGEAQAVKAALDGNPEAAKAMRKALLAGDAEGARQALLRLIGGGSAAEKLFTDKSGGERN